MEENKEVKKEKVFAEGVFFSKPREGAPDFIKGNVSLDARVIDFYNKHKNNGGYVNLDLKESKGGKLYLEVNEWEPKAKDASDDSPF